MDNQKDTDMEAGIMSGYIWVIVKIMVPFWAAKLGPVI